MKTTSISVEEFIRKFPDSDACLEHLFKVRYGKLKFCPQCRRKSPRFYRVRGRRCYECGSCGHQISPVAGTMMHGSGTSLFRWFLAIYLYSNAKNGISSYELQRAIGVSYKTAYKMGNCIRNVLGQTTGRLSGHIELDEALFGPRCKGKRGWGAGKKASLFGMLQRGGELRIVIVKNRKRTTLVPIIQTNIRKRATVSTDEFKVYRGLDQLGYTHGMVVHHKYQWTNGIFSTNGVEGSWSNLKKTMLGTHTWVSSKKLPGYINAYVFRYNCRNKNTFEEILARAIGRTA